MRTIVLLCSLFVIIFSSCQQNMSDRKVADQKELKIKNKESRQILRSYVSSFKKNVTRSSTKQELPAYFGGTYIDDNENPVILTTEIDKTKLIKQIAGSDKVIVKKCSYSYQELSDLKDEILVRLKEQPEVADKIEVSTFGAHISMNCMEVSIIHCTPEKIELFKSQISDSPMLKFTSDSGYVEIRGNHQETKKPSLKSVNVKSSRKYELFPATYVYGESELLTISFPVVITLYMGLLHQGIWLN